MDPTDWIEWIGNCVIALVPILMGWMVRLLQKHAGISMQEAHRKQIEELVRQGVGFAQHIGRQRLKRAPDEPLPGPAKRAEAVNYIQKRARAEGVALPVEETLDQLIDAEVGRLKTGEPVPPGR